jgi:hypothetical protein
MPSVGTLDILSGGSQSSGGPRLRSAMNLFWQLIIRRVTLTSHYFQTGKVATGAMADPVLATTSYRDLSRCATISCATISFATLWPQSNTNGIHIEQMIQIQGLEDH